MAIKGKSRGRSKPKPVTPGPRPAYVPVKRPWWQKRGFWIGVLVVLVLGSAAAIWYGVAKNMTKEHEAEQAKRLASAAREYQQLVETIVTPLGRAAPTGFDALPELKDVLDRLSKGTVKPELASKVATNVADRAKLAHVHLDEIDVTKTFGGKGFTADLVLFALNSRAKMVTAFKLYEQAARMIVLAGELEGDSQKELIADAQSIVDVASQTFRDGYADYVQVQAAAGILKPTIPTAPGVPGVP